MLSWGNMSNFTPNGYDDPTEIENWYLNKKGSSPKFVGSTPRSLKWPLLIGCYLLYFC